MVICIKFALNVGLIFVASNRRKQLTSTRPAFRRSRKMPNIGTQLRQRRKKTK